MKKEKKRILNLGCESSFYGTDRIDLYKTISTTRVGNVEKGLPYPDNYFDEIYSKSVIEHVKNIGTFAEECFRVLKKGGKVRIITDHAYYLPGVLFRKYEHNVGLEVNYKAGAFGHKQDEDAHYHLFVKSHLDKLFNKFKNRKFIYHLGGRNPILKGLLCMLPNNAGACHIELIAYK